MNKALEREYRDLCTVIDWSQGKKLEKEWVKSDILKTLKRCGYLDTSAWPPDFKWNLVSARLRNGRFDNWDGWEFRGDFAATFHYRTFATPKWMGQEITRPLGLKVCGEQGIGDEILFLSALSDLMWRIGKNFEVYCHPRLIPILERSFRIKASGRPGSLADVDGEYMCLLGDLLRWYRRHKSHFPGKPFLKPDAEKTAYWRQWLGPGRHIGYAWKSRHGCIDPESIRKTEAGSEARYWCLQYDIQAPDTPPFDVKNDLENLFAFVSALDKVVSVTQTLVHVAGSVGTECHAIEPPRGTGEVDAYLWYYGNGGPHPVYGSVTVYRSIHDWRSRRN